MNIRVLAAGMIIPLAMGLTGCAKKAQVDNTQGGNNSGIVMEAAPAEIMNSRPAGYLLKTTVFKMSGDYSNNVAVTMDGSGQLLYFPAPTDITPSSRPVELENGWWLNRQGLGAGSVFTRYTFDEYAALKEVPSVEEIKAAVIPGARVVDFRTLPIPASEAMGKLDEIKILLQK